MYMKTSISEKIAYGMGDVACNVVYALTSGLIVYFYTNVIGVSAGVVGTILLVSRVFDGVSAAFLDAWLTHFPTLNSVRITSSDCTADLPTVLLPRLHRLFHFRLVLSTRVPTVLFT